MAGNILSDYSNTCVYKHRCLFVSRLLSINMQVSAEDLQFIQSVVCFVSLQRWCWEDRNLHRNRCHDRHDARRAES